MNKSKKVATLNTLYFLIDVAELKIFKSNKGQVVGILLLSILELIEPRIKAMTYHTDVC